MKLVQKLSLALILGIMIVLSANGYLRVRREVALFQTGRVRDHELLGLALSAAFSAVWRTEGEAHAKAMLVQASAREGQISIRWVPSRPEGLDEPASSGPSSRVSEDDEGQPVRRTFVPFATGALSRRPMSDPPGGLLISESLAAERRYVRRTVIDTALTTALLAVVAAALTAAVGAWFVGKPIHSLAEKARRVGRGDFSGPLHLRQRDELADLSREMNSMCEKLVEATERSAAETSARIAALEQLRHADRLMTVGKLASGIAHELGTPLNVVGARAGMIADRETTPEESVEYARVIVQACDQMIGIIRQLLDFARPRGQERSVCDLGSIVQRTLKLLEPMASKKGVTLSFVEEGAPGMLELDASQMQQVFTNLVVNAIQAMGAPGVVEVTIDRARRAPPALLDGVEATPSPGTATACVAARVRDEGCGIAAENLPHVFEPFFTTKDVGQGTGLGLSVAYGIVREHGGWMEVESALGKGSEFTVFLPLAMEEAT